MDSRRLNRRVLLQRLSGSVDAAGQPVPGFANLIATGDGMVWGNVRNLSGLETIKADAGTSVVKTSIRIRRRTDVTAAMQAVCGGVTYKIKAVMPDEQDKDYMDLACEVLSGG